MLVDKHLVGLLVAWMISVAAPTEITHVLTAGTADHGNHLDEKLNVYNATFFVGHLFEKYGDRNVLTYEGFEHLLENLGLGRLNFETGHDVSVHKVNGTFYELHDEKDLHRHWHEEVEKGQPRAKRHSALSNRQKSNILDADESSNLVCLSPQEILMSYGLEPSHGVVISPDNFQQLCPAIVYELDQKHCWVGSVKHDGHKESHRLQMQVWLEASVAILVMSVAGIACAAVVPILNRCDSDGTFLHFLVAIAAGTLAGDAIIHLLPQVLMRRFPSEAPNAAILRGTVTLLSIFLFYILETILLFIYKQGSKNADKEASHEEGEMLKNSHSHAHNVKRREGPLACVVIAGDVLHNITDGLSVGAAFSMSRGAGLACATAVFCHELPHELGDYAVLLREGMRIRRALFCNIFSSVFSFIGMSVGILLGEFMDATPWVNAFTAGSFLYIALANLIPELKGSSTVSATISQLIGLLAGIFLMFCIALYEHDWEDFMTSQGY